MTTNQAEELMRTKLPAWWFYLRPRKVLIEDVLRYRGASDTAFCKVLYRGFRVDIEPVSVNELFTTAEECAEAQKRKL